MTDSRNAAQATYDYIIVGAGSAGCELCVPACPVDCIVLEPMPPDQIDAAHADVARTHFQRRESRLERQRIEREAELAARKAAVDTATGPVNPVLAALARARDRKSTRLNYSH